MAYNPLFPTGYQPIYPQTQTQTQAQPQNTGRIYVQGEASAKSYLVAPNSTVTLWDLESPTIYVKSADASGLPSMRVFDYTERTETSVQKETVNYITKEEFDALKTEIDAIKSTLKKGEKK